MSSLSTSGTTFLLALPPGTFRRGVNLGPLVYQQRVTGVVLIGTKDGFGAGAVIPPRGDIITSEHVVQNAHRAQGADWVAIWFRPTGAAPGFDLAKFILGRVVYKDAGRDLAVVRLADPLPSDAAAIPLATAPPVVGEEVFTIGHPKGYAWSFAQSIVSQVRPDYSWSYTDGIRRSATAIQTQTPMNPGSSGGPLLNGEGAVVGIVVGAVPDAKGIYFAVAAQHVKELANR